MIRQCFWDKVLKEVWGLRLIELWDTTDIRKIEHEEKHIVVTEEGYARALKRFLDGEGLAGLGGLDIGCGGGLMSNYLAGRGAIMASMDLSFFSVKYAVGEGRVLGVQGNAEFLPFRDRSLDFCLCTDVIEHVVEYDRVLLEIGRVIKDGGCLYISIPYDRSAKNIIMDIVFPMVKGVFMKVIGRSPPTPSRGHMHVFGKREFIERLGGEGFSLVSVTELTLPDISRNRFIVIPAAFLVGLVFKSSRIDQLIFKFERGHKAL